ALRELRDRETELVARLDTAKAQAAKPLADSWREGKGLIDLLDAAPHPHGRRLRPRSPFRRGIGSVWVVVVPPGPGRLCAVQVNFAGTHPLRAEEGGATAITDPESKGYRRYFIIHRPPRTNQYGKTPGRWYAQSLKQPEAALAGLSFGAEDLRWVRGEDGRWR